jgi:hypothetical protein
VSVRETNRFPGKGSIVTRPAQGLTSAQFAFRELAMENRVRRPSAIDDPGGGVLLESHFQVAYVTTDIARACEVLKRRYGLKAFQQVEGDMPDGRGYMRAAFGWAGPVMYELIQAEGPGAAFYTQRLPQEGFAIRHHHLGYLVESRAAWDALMARIAREGWSVAFRAQMPDFMDAIYIEAPELEHYLEYMLPEPAGVAFLEAIPRS